MYQPRHRTGIARMCAKSCPTRTLGILMWIQVHSPQKLNIRQEHKQVEWFINNYKALVLHTLVLRIKITHMSDPIKSTAPYLAHKIGLLNPQHCLLPTKRKAVNHLTTSDLRDFLICAPWDKLRMTWL